MTAIRDDVFDGLDAALAAIAGLGEYDVMPAGDPVKFPALHLIDNGQGPEPNTEAHVNRYALAFSIEGYVVSDAGGRAAHKDMNALYAKAVAAIMAFADTSPMIEDVEEGTLRVVTAKLAEVRTIGFSLDFTLIYATRRGDPENL
ncbi:MAG: hypothetical protein E2598_07510 [Sphingobium sp.]|nr:hypothetical protein [Sphingobium sp.]